MKHILRTLALLTHRAAVLRSALAAGIVAVSGLAAAQGVTTFHVPPGVGKPSYSEAVEVRAGGLSTLYVSGLVPEPLDAGALRDSRAYFGDTQAQTDGILKRLKALLERHSYPGPQSITYSPMPSSHFTLDALPSSRRSLAVTTLAAAWTSRLSNHDL
jgi:hypothetical protein